MIQFIGDLAWTVTLMFTGFIVLVVIALYILVGIANWSNGRVRARREGKRRRRMI